MKTFPQLSLLPRSFRPFISISQLNGSARKMLSDSSQASLSETLDLDVVCGRGLGCEPRIVKLTAQSPDALGVSSELAHVSKENADLRQHVIELESKNTELSHRLEISVRANSENERSNAQKIRSLEASHMAAMCELQAKVESMCSDRARERHSVRKLESDCEAKVRESESECCALRSQISKVLNGAEFYFRRKFGGVKELVEFLNYPEAPAVVEAAEVSDELIGQNEELVRKLKKARAKCGRLKEEKRELELKIVEVQQKMETDAVNAAEEFQKLKNQFEMHEREVAMLRVASERQGIPPPVVKKRNQGCQCTDREHEEQMTSLQQVNLDCNTEIEEKATAISMLQMKIRGLSEELENKETERKAVANKAKLFKKSRNELQTQLNQARHEIDRARLEVETLKCEAESNLNDYYVKESKLKAQMEETETKCINLRGAVRKLEKLVETQKDEIGVVTAARDALVCLVMKQNRMLDAVPVVSAEEPLPKIVETVVEVEPSFVWEFSDIPCDLRRILSEIADSPRSPISSRIRNAFIVVSKWIKGMQSRHETDLAQMEAKLDEVNNDFNHYRRTIANYLGATGVMTAKEVCDIVGQMNDEVTELKRNVYILQCEEKRLCASLESTDFNLIIEKYRDMQSDLKFLAERVLLEKSKLKDRKRHFSNALSIYEKKYEQTVASFQTALDNAKEQEGNLRKEIDALQKQNEGLIEQLKAYTHHNHDSPSTSSEHDWELPERQVFDRETVRDQEMKISELEAKIETLTKNLESWKEAARLAQERLTSNQRTYLSAIERSEAKCEQQKTKLIKEMADAKQRSDLIIEEIRNQVLDNKATIATLQKQLDTDRQKLKEAQLTIQQQKHELEKAHMNEVYQNEAIERAKKLVEIQVQAKTIAFQTQLSQTMEDQKCRLEKQKKNLISTFISSFSHYANITGDLNEQTFVNCIAAVKEHIEKYKAREETIRRVIHAQETEDVDDAVVRFVIEHHPSL